MTRPPQRGPSPPFPYRLTALPFRDRSLSQPKNVASLKCAEDIVQSITFAPVSSERRAGSNASRKQCLQIPQCGHDQDCSGYDRVDLVISVPLILPPLHPPHLRVEKTSCVWVPPGLVASRTESTSQNSQKPEVTAHFPSGGMHAASVDLAYPKA